MLKGIQVTDIKERTKIYERSQKIFHEEVGAIPIAHALQSMPMSKKVQDFKNHPFGNIYFHKVWLK